MVYEYGKHYINNTETSKHDK